MHTHAAHTRRSRHSLRLAPALSLLLLLAAWLALAPRLQAQTLGEVVAEPFSSEQFDRLMGYARLDYAQRLAAEAAHEEYKQRFAELRDRDLSPYMIRFRRFTEGMMGGMPDRGTIEQLLRERRQMVDRMTVLDRDLFEAISQQVRDDQQPRIDRARRQRERAYYRLASSMHDIPDVDLSELVARLRLPAELEAEIDPVLTSWETSYTNALRDAQEKSLTGITRVFDMMADSGFDPGAMMMGGGEEFDEDAQAAMMAAMEDFNRRIEQIMAEPTRIAKEAHDLTRRTARQIEPMLPAAESRRFRRMSRVWFHPEFFPDHSSLERAFEYALEQESLAAHHADLEAARQAYEVEVETIHREMIRENDAFAELQRTMRMGTGYDPEAWTRHWELTQELRNRRDEVNERHAERLEDLLSNEDYYRVISHRGPGPDEQRWSTGGSSDFPMMAEDGDDFNEMAIVVDADEWVDAEASDNLWQLWSNAGLHYMHGMPSPLTAADLRVWCVRLNATNDQRDILLSLLEGYMEDYQTALKGPVSRVLKPIFEADVDYNDQEAVQRHHRATQAAYGKTREHLLQVDMEFIESVSTLLSPGQQESLAAVKRSVERRHLAMEAYGWEIDNQVDPIVLLTRMRPSDEVWRVIEVPLRSYEEETFKLIDQRRKVVRERDEVQQRMSELWQSGQPDQRQMMEIQATWQQAYQAVGEVDEQLSEAAERTIAEFIQVLPPDDAAAFEKRVNRLMFPDVYPDQRDALPVLQAAAALRDLSPAARAQVEDLIAEHTREHDRFSAAMIESARAQRRMHGGMGMMMAGDGEESWGAIMENGERALYDRNEWNTTMRRRLRALLTEEQCERVRGLNR